jgi:hypothetical protein
MENKKKITDKKVSFELERIWNKLLILQHYDNRKKVTEIMGEILSLREEIRNRMYLTELEKENI